MARTTQIPTISSTLVLIAILGVSNVAHCQDALEGFSHPHRVAQVAAATSGIIQEWLVEEGEFVSAGQPLVKLDDSRHQQLLRVAEVLANSRGELELAQAEQELRRQRLEAIEKLAASGHATPDELHRVQTESRVAAARVLTAQEHQLRYKIEYDKIQSEREDYIIKAPFDGVVKVIHKLKGEFVGPIEPEVCELADLTSLTALFLVPHQELGALQSGDLVQVRFPLSDEPLEGKVTLSPYPDAETGTRSVKVRIANPAGQLRAGQPCTLLLD